MKTSTAQLKANRRNAQKSSGPKTAEGKAASSRNSFRHGLSGGDVVILPNENKDHLDQLIADLTAEFKPVTKAEQFHVDQMIHARWQLLRVRRLEAEALEAVVEGEGHAAPDRRLLAAMETPGNVLDKLDRYAARAQRSYAKAVRDLTELRARSERIRKQNEAKQADLEFYRELARSRPRIDPFAGAPFPAPRHEPAGTVEELPARPRPAAINSSRT